MRTWLVTLTLAVVVVPSAGAQGKKPLAVEDLYRVGGPRHAVLSPDGGRVAYVRHWIDPRTKEEHQSLWTVDRRAELRQEPGNDALGAQGQLLEPGEPDARLPRFTPDGKWIVFLSTRPRPQGWRQLPVTPPESDPALDIWLIPAAGGAALPLAGAAKQYGRVFADPFYGRLAFAPDGKRLAFVADDGADPRTPEEIAHDVLIVRPDQGEGYTGFGPAQIRVAQLDDQPGACAARKIERLTSDDVWYGDPQWSRDGAMLVVHANRTKEQESVRFSINRNFDLWALEVATKKLTQLTTGPGPEVSPRFSPDGKRIACLSIPRRGTHRDLFNLAVVHMSEGGAHLRTVFDHHGPAGDRPPHPAPLFALPDDCWDGDHVIFTGETGTTNTTVRVELRSGQIVKDTSPERARRQRQIDESLPPANAFLKERLLGESNIQRWQSDGFDIEGVLTLPPAGVAQPPYKLLVHPHGGPHGRSPLGFDFTVQLFAAHGYAVFQPNFRGSSGYGQKFIDADRGDFGGGDMRDILAGIDHLVKQKIADPRRQFVYGTSYGGFMTTWLVGQTTQFRAAAAQNAVTDLNMMWSLSDLQSWVEWEFGGRPWEVPAALRQHSPLTHAGNVKTPTLILHATGDRRCPAPMGKAFHQALLAQGVPTQMVLYPNEGHGIRQPRHREDLYRRVLAWFEKHK